MGEMGIGLMPNESTILAQEQIQVNSVAISTLGIGKSIMLITFVMKLEEPPTKRGGLYEGRLSRTVLPKAGQVVGT